MKRDAQTFYRNLSTNQRKILADMKAQEARKTLEKLGLPQVNRISERVNKDANNRNS